jgi:hypothetical protein
MKKLILTLFLASASLVSFAQSTVKTIRIATPATLITENIPQGTQVVMISTNVVYTATVGIASGTGDFADFADAIANNALVTVTDTSVYSVIDEVVAASCVTTAVALSVTRDGADIAIEAKDFKVYVNGSLLATGAYAYDSAVGASGTVTVTSDFYEYDQVSVVYNTIK